MPGILPMKVIKIGTSAQSRIAQACDRCRSKKIRCDGIAPCCTQCANVGFECKTSDKLSRRAFPRGYTESLEDRVRTLETEVKELKDLLDEKEEKIDLLSKVHSTTRRPPLAVDLKGQSVRTEMDNKKEALKENEFTVQQSSGELLRDQHSSFLGAASGKMFIEALKSKIQERGKPGVELTTEMIYEIKKPRSLAPGSSLASSTYNLPPRLVADQLINIYFQEWAPLFPVLHRPTFLNMYSEYVTSSESLRDQKFIAQLNLVFGIAALSAESNLHKLADFERQWQAALCSITRDCSLGTVQCLVLAQIFCIVRGDYNGLLYYKGISISIVYQLGLHRSQDQISSSVLTSETRKKVFWTQYTLDGFSAATRGLPRMIRDSDVYIEYPRDVDDENVSDNGFQKSASPGESTRLSNALALFRLARVLSRVLDEVYPAANSYVLSLQRLGALEDELSTWLHSLGPHHRLQFFQDKPSTKVIGSRSPLLSLAYHYIRTLIHRPAAGSALGIRASSSVVAVAKSSKHIIQILQLLEERRMSFSFCLNKNEVLLLSGFGLLFQGLDLDLGRRLMQDSQRLICIVIKSLERSASPSAEGFKKLASAVFSCDQTHESAPTLALEVRPRKTSNDGAEAPRQDAKQARERLRAIANRISFSTSRVLNGRRTTPVPAISKPMLYTHSKSRDFASSTSPDPVNSAGYPEPAEQVTASPQNKQMNAPNLDYLSFALESSTSRPFNSYENQPRETCSEHLAGRNAPSQAQPLYPSLFSSTEALSTYVSSSSSVGTYEWSPDHWGLPSDMGCNLETAQSALSLSEEEVPDGRKMAGFYTKRDFQRSIMPTVDAYGGLEGFDGFGL